MVEQSFDEQALVLLKAFRRITNPEERQRIINLVEAVAANGASDIDPPANDEPGSPR